MRLLRYVFRRLILLIPILLAAVFIAFFLTRIVPGNPLEQAISPYASEEERARLISEARLDRPFYEQFIFYVGDLLQGDMGVSYTTSQNVAVDLFNRFPATFELVTYATILAILIAIPLGVISAIYKDRSADHIGRFVSVAGVSLPVFWLALLFLYVFFFQLGWAPAPLGRLNPLLSAPERITGLYTIDALIAGDLDLFRSAAGQLVLPVLTLAFTAMAPIARMTRSSMVEALASEYIRTARALGLPSRTIYWRHAFKNAAIPILTMIAAVYGFALGGAVLIEFIFAWPGMGLYAINAIFASDFPAIQGFILLVTAVYVLIFLLVDVISAILDPRIEF